MQKRELFIFVALVIITAGIVVGFFPSARRNPEPSVPGQEAPSAPAPAQPPARQQRRPNVVVITLDTTRADHLGAYNPNGAKTPNIDALAQGGVMFQRAIAVAPITLPSHSSIMTGLYPPSHGVRDNGTFALPETVETLAEVLKAEGYATGAFIGAAVLERRYGLTQGFDVYDDDFSRGRRQQQFMYAERSCEQVVAAASQWVAQQQTTRFFSWLHFYDAHAGYSPPEPWATKYEEQPYDGEIAYSDHCVGTFLDTLRARSDWSDTLVIITADHGESLGEHGEKTHGLFIYDATLHVPLIFYYPAAFPAGRVVDALVSSVDIFPTVLSILGKALPAALDGKSLVSLMQGGKEPTRRIAYSETLLPKYHYGWAELSGVTTQTWKLIEAPRPELYSLAQDPKELVNIHDRDPNVVRDLTKRLQTISAHAQTAESRLALDSETAERLRGLGYIWMPGPEEEQAHQTPPDPKDMIYTHLYVQQGREFYRRERFDEAIGEYQKVLAANPRSLSTYFDLALTYLAKDEPEQARQALTSALNLDPQNPRVYTMMGVVENRLGHKDEALKLFDRATEIDPHFEDAYINKAAVFEQTGKLDKAEETVRSVLKMTPTHTGALSRLGRILLTQGKSSEVEPLLRAALKTDPYNLQAQKTLGVLYDQAGRFDDALAAYQESLKADGRQPDVHSAIGVIYAKQGKLDQAEVQLQEALRLDPTLSEALISLAIIYDQKRLWEKALAANQQAVQLNARAYQAYGNMAVVHLKKGEYAKAEELLHQALAIKPDYPEGYSNLAVLYMKEQKPQQAMAAAEQALHYRPDYPEALTNLGILYDQQGQRARAVEYHQRALASNPGYWQARYNLALTFLHLQRYTEAAEELVTVLRTQPDLPAAHKYLGDLYFEHLKERDKARAHYKIYLEFGPPQAERRQIEGRLRATS